MARRSRTSAKYAHLPPPPAPKAQAKASRFHRVDPEGKQAAEHLRAIERDDDCSFVQEQARKFSGLEATAELGLQLRDELVNSFMHRDSGHGDTTPVDTVKLAASAEAIEQLSSLVGELRSSSRQSLKVAAALAGAVKLAQDGAIDVEDIFDVAREATENGTVKLSSADQIFDLSPGEIVEDAGPHVAQATGPAVPGFLGAQGGSGTDILTATLRSLRR